VSHYKVRPALPPPLIYSAFMAPTRHALDTREAIARMSGYLERLFFETSERLKDRVAERIAERVTPKVAARLPELESYLATMEVLGDEEALDDLRVSAQDSDSDLRDYDTIRREVGLA
jgi:hypothetical protein